MKRHAYIPPVFIIIAVAAICVVKNARDSDQYYHGTAMMMSTVAQISIWGSGEVSLRAAADSALATMARIDSLFGGGLVGARSADDLVNSPEFRHLLEVSKQAYYVTDGGFDPTVGRVSKLWEFCDGAQPPPGDSIVTALRSVGLDRYLAGTRSRDFVFDFGGIAKGYAVDLAALNLRNLGFRSAIVDAGGDMRLLGERPDGKPWRIAIRHPRRKDAFIACLELEDVAVATSGDYERFFMHCGQRYHHILDPRTGMPGCTSTSVTVIARNACLGDALATGLFLVGHERGLEIVESLPGVEAVFVYAEGESIAFSTGLAGHFERLDFE
jgi:thiamine biosynthesis lipoprotein